MHLTISIQVKIPNSKQYGPCWCSFPLSTQEGRGKFTQTLHMDMDMQVAISIHTPAPSQNCKLKQYGPC